MAGVQEAVTHLVLGRGPATGGAFRLLGTVKGPTGALQQIVLQPKKAWRGMATHVAGSNATALAGYARDS